MADDTIYLDHIECRRSRGVHFWVGYAMGVFVGALAVYGLMSGG